MREVIEGGRYAGWTVSDWTDLTLEKLKWQLDADRKHPGTLDPWMRPTIFAILRDAKTLGADFRLTGKRFRQAREIIKAKPAEKIIE